MKVTLTEQNFSYVLTQSSLVLIHFTSDFCGPCNIMKRALDKIESRESSTVLLAEVKAIDYPDWSIAFAVQSTPTVLLFIDGKYKSRIVGAQTVQTIERWIKEATA